MEPTFEDKLRAAVAAGWRALVAQALFVTLVWLLYLGTAQSQSGFWLSLWGPNVTWAMAARISVWAITIYKVALWLQAGALLWAWMWSRALRKETQSAAHESEGRIVVTRVPAAAIGS